MDWSRIPWTIGTGAVGFGGDQSPTRKRPDLCADHAHPGVTYNPWLDRTWCLCGAVTYEGNAFTQAACCGGPLEEAVTGHDNPAEEAA